MYQVEAEKLKGPNKGKRCLAGNPDLLMTHSQACNTRPDLNRLYLVER